MIGLVLALLVAPPDSPAVRPNLVFTASAGARSVSRLEPAVALRLEAGEAAHPEIAPGDEFRWAGTVNLTRPGEYRFTARGEGRVKVSVGGQAVIDGVAPREGAAVRLAAGVQPFEATLTRTGPVAALTLFWSGPGFVPEAVPYFVLGHRADQRPARLSADLEREQGRFAFGEFACARCHVPAGSQHPTAKSLAERAGPDLSAVASRVKPGWLDAWLADPTRLRPHTAMPKLFADDEAGKNERLAVGAFLRSQGAPLRASAPPAVSREYGRDVASGQKLYLTVGCAACHGESLTGAAPRPAKPVNEDEDEPLPPRPVADSAHGLHPAGLNRLCQLGALGSKTTPEALARYLRDPLATSPHGRMPSLNLTDNEARDLARFLCRQTDDALPADAPTLPAQVPDGLIPADLAAKAAKLSAADQWREAGRHVFAAKGCAQCHPSAKTERAAPPVERFGFALAAIDFTAKQPRPEAGCLADKPDAKAVPVYMLSVEQKAALKRFVTESFAPGIARSAAPVAHARAAFERFQCLNCHQRDGEGGLGASLQERMRTLADAESAEDLSPPRLTGVGQKLKPDWFRQVLLNGGRARPWMGLRMPQYGAANVGHLPVSVPKLEGVPSNEPVAAPFQANLVEAGRTLTGKSASGYGCIACHDIAGVRGGGTRGPDLARVPERVRADWFPRWMHQPQRLAPGTKMPQNFLDGKGQITSVLDGDGDRQIAALWTYLSLGPTLPLPAGLEPPKGLVVVVKERPQILRTFLSVRSAAPSGPQEQDATGTRPIAVGFPGGVNVAYDAATCRLSYAWSGQFLDATPAWNARGGNQAKLLGAKFWASNAGFPWALTASHTPPDFAARASDPRYGRQLPEDRVAGVAKLVRFDGYALDAAGVPTFRAALLDAESRKPTLSVRDTATPLPVTVVAGFKRSLSVDLPPRETAWFHVGPAGQEPRLVGKAGPIDLETPAAGTRAVVPNGDGTATLVEVLAAPVGTVWHVVPATKDAPRQLLLRLPESPAARTAELTLAVWGLPRDDAGLIAGVPAVGR